MNLPATPSIQRATQHYENIVASMDLTRTYSMQEMNAVIARYCTDHDLSELEHDNILEIKYDRMLSDTSEARMPTQGESH